MAGGLGAGAGLPLAAEHGGRRRADHRLAGVGGVMNHISLLTTLLFLPLAGALLLLPLGGRARLARIIALSIGLVETVLAGSAWFYQGNLPTATAPPGFFLFADLPWIEALGIRYTLGMDGISLLLVMLTALVTVIAMLVSWRSIDKRVSLHYLLLLAMESGIMGVFLCPGPVPVLPLLGADADPDVLPDRHLGAWSQHLLGGQVLPLHPVRLAADAAGHYRHLPDSRGSERQLQLRSEPH